MTTGLTALGVKHRGESYVIVAAQSLEPIDRSVGRVVKLLLLAGPAALLATALGGWWLARRSLRPIEEITSTAEAIGVDLLEERLPVSRSNDEVAHLARTLNTMLDRIQHGVDEQRDVLLSAREEVDRMSRTVGDLLTLAAVDGNVLGLRLEDVDLAELAEAVAVSLGSVARRRGVTVRRHGPAVAVLADPVRLSHAIRNLVENALDFSPQGGLVQITTSRADTTGRLVVEDDGPGVPAALRERIFDRFFRVDPSRNRATGGSGLGLAITREIVEALGGRVHTEGRERGSAFVIEVPCALPAPDPRPGAGVGLLAS